MWQFFEDTSQQLFSILAPELSPTDRFFMSIEKGEKENIVSFLNSNNNININSITNSSGNRPIHVASRYGHEDIVYMFVDNYNADINQLGSDGNSCLHFSAINGNSNLVKYFISKGLSPCTRNRQGKNAYDVAEGFGLKQMLMPLIFAEEERTGTAPVIEGATRDLRKDAERIKNLAPPPPAASLSMQPPPLPSIQQQHQQTATAAPYVTQPPSFQYQQQTPIQQQTSIQQQIPAQQVQYAPPIQQQLPPIQQQLPSIQQQQFQQQQPPPFQQQVPQPAIMARPPATPISQMNYNNRPMLSTPKVNQTQTMEKQAPSMSATSTPPPTTATMPAYNPPRQIQFRPVQVYSQTPRQGNS